MQIILRQFVNFPVAVFIFLSGFFASTKKMKYRDYIISRAQRILIPFLIWSAFYSVVNVASDLMDFKPVNLLSVAKAFFFGHAAGPLYYNLVLLQLTLLTPFFVKVLKESKAGTITLWFLTPLYLIYIYSFNILAGSTPPQYMKLFPAWLIFYLIGLTVRIRPNVQPVKLLSSKGSITVAILVSIAEAFLLLSIGVSYVFAISQIKGSSFLFAACIIFYLLQHRTVGKAFVNTGKPAQLIKALGDCSYGIFLLPLVCFENCHTHVDKDTFE